MGDVADPRAGRLSRGRELAAVGAAGRHAPSARPHQRLRGAAARDGGRVLSAVAGTLVRELGLEPGNAHVVWDELSAGRVHTGGYMPGT